jgi:hypothetical protein
MRCFSAGCDVEILTLDLTEIDLPIPALPAIESKTWSLKLSAMDVQDPDHFRQAFGETLGALTLPLLQHLTLLASGYQPLSWPRHQFLACASRSSFRHTLTNFLLDNIIISEDELVECLSEMSALRELFVHDVPALAVGDAHHILVTDSLLRRLTWTSDPSCLAPYLTALHVGSFFTFDPDVLLDFVESRVVPGRAGGHIFGIELLRLGEPGPEMNESALARLLELVGLGQLRCVIRRQPCVYSIYFCMPLLTPGLGLRPSKSVLRQSASYMPLELHT